MSAESSPSIGSASDDEASLNETIQKLDTNLPQGKLINRKEQKQKGKSTSVTGLTGYLEAAAIRSSNTQTM